MFEHSYILKMTETNNLAACQEQTSLNPLLLMNENTRYTIGIDIGGSHIAGALTSNGRYVSGSFVRESVDSSAPADSILDKWAEAINFFINAVPTKNLHGIGIAMPGPFDYERGISMITGLNKYESLFALNIKEALRDRLAVKDLPITFTNDASCFGIGEAMCGHTGNADKAIAITLGTGLGACFLRREDIVTSGPGVPEGGYLYNFPFEGSIAEHYLSESWLVTEYNILTGKNVRDVKTITNIALQYAASEEEKKQKETAIDLFDRFGKRLGQFIAQRLDDYNASALVIGGGIAKANFFFKTALFAEIEKLPQPVQVYFADNTELSTIIGAAGLVPANENTWTGAERLTHQRILPKYINELPQISTGYRSYPYQSLGKNSVFEGYEMLADWIIANKTVCIDGATGVNWNIVTTELCKAIRARGHRVCWYESDAFLKSPAEIDQLLLPFVGDAGSVWGTKATVSMQDFFKAEFIHWSPSVESAIIIIAGCGAALSATNAPVVYIDLPKSELQYRMRAGAAFNVGSKEQSSYKRAYFVDWPVIAQHRRAIQQRIKIIVDGQHEASPNWVNFDDLQTGLSAMSSSVVRSRPWFEPGVWGGQWMKQYIPGIVQEEINYAWSFELISLENGLLFEGDGRLLEISFEWLMELHTTDILGNDAARFGTEFPIRFDFLDTVDGGDLSIQCHPSLGYIQEHFGERITQDETYYILDCTEDANVYLGFTDTINVDDFRKELELSQAGGHDVVIENFVQKIPAQKHELYLIPNQTVHGAGRGNLVLEISAAPYIYTFKMYDWNRPDLNGGMRPINIEHAFRNLDFDRKGHAVHAELISRPVVIEQTDTMRIESLPTHPLHFYAIDRIVLPAHSGCATLATNNKCRVLMVVEGGAVQLSTSVGGVKEMYFAETFVIPAAAQSFELTNTTDKTVMVICAYIKSLLSEQSQ